MTRRKKNEKPRISFEFFLGSAGCRAAGCTDVLADWRVSENARSFNKRRAAKMRWTIYRKVEKLPFFKAVRVFAAYTLNGIRKHKRI